MPQLSTTLHLDMLARFRRRIPFKDRLSWFLKKIGPMDRKVYGLNWGDPEQFAPLRFIRDRYVLPYVKREQTALEIGPGGGRWTRYLLPFRKLYVVDYHQELLDELRRNFNKRNLLFVKNGGSDFPGIPDASVDFIFTFGTFVHLDTPIIEAYLKGIRKILVSGGNAVLQYSDKNKIMARENAGFSENTPKKMRQMAAKAGLRILEEDLTTLWHSSLMRVTI